MHLQKETTSTEKIFYLITTVVITGILLRFNLGISGNDFWWHIKVGDWILENHAVPKIGIFSWYAINSNLEWVSHEWLSEVLLYTIHHIFGNMGIFLLSIFACIGLLLLIIVINKQRILDNTLLASIFLLLSTIILPTFFYGRPQIFSAYLLIFTFFCLYRFVQNQSKLIFLLPFVSILWSNLHGGSSNMPYILCFIFAFSGLFGFSYSHLESEKHNKKQRRTVVLVALISFMSTAINPHGIKMLLYPYINMGDSLMLSFIQEWQSPDAKSFEDVILCFLPILLVSLVLLLTNKKLKLYDLLIFLFFAYLTFRSMRFVLLFYIATSFFTFEYMPPGKIQDALSNKAKILISLLCAFLLVINISSSVKIYNLASEDQLISVSLDNKYVSLIKNDKPKRLFNDYNFSDTLIYNDIPTFVDARADIFSKYNFTDYICILSLKPIGLETDEQNNIILKDYALDVDTIIEKYQFDAFLVEPDRSLATYLLSHPEKYRLLLSDENASYFKVIAD